MGWSPLDEKNPSGEAVIGDEPFDLVSDCFSKVVRVYKRHLKRKPSLKELVGTVQAVLQTQIQDHTSDGATSELTSLTYKTRKIPKRQKYAVGDILKAEAANGEPIYARIFLNEDPGCGPFVGVYDSLGMPSTDLVAIIQRPLIVIIFPIHRELLERRGWLVIGNKPLTPADEALPRGQRVISGCNEQLDAANYHYGLGPKTSFITNACLVTKKYDPT